MNVKNSDPKCSLNRCKPLRGRSVGWAHDIPPNTKPPLLEVESTHQSVVE